MAKKYFSCVINNTMTILPINNAKKIINSFEQKQSKFNSTKELYAYAKKKILYSARNLKKEYLIIADTKKNIIIDEKLGENEFVSVNSWLIPNDRKNITILHGHPKKNYPLSLTDCAHLCRCAYDKIIAFDTKGHFSLLQILPNTDLKQALNFFDTKTYLKHTETKSVFKRFLHSLFYNNKKYKEQYIKSISKQKNTAMRYYSTMF
jgi:hypothetical protein